MGALSNGGCHDRYSRLGLLTGALRRGVSHRTAWWATFILIAGIRLAYPDDFPSYWHHDWSIPSYNAIHLTWQQSLTARGYGAAGATNAELWLYHALFWLFGARTWVVHLPNALASLGVCLCVYGITARLVDRRTGLIAMALLGTQWVFLLFSRTPELEIFLLPLALGLWIAIAGWCYWPCCILAGAVAATSAWSWRAAMIGIPLALVCVLFTPQWWRYPLRWLRIAAGAAVVLWPLYQHGDFPLFAEKLGYRQWEWTPAVWLEQIDHTVGALWGKYPNTEAWGMTKQTQLLLPVDLVLFIFGIITGLWNPAARRLTFACITAILVVCACGGVLIRHTYTDWCHLLAMLPFCAVLMALGTRNDNAVLVLIVLSVSTNLLQYYCASQTAPANITTVNRILADSRSANCVSVLHQGLPLDSAFFWFVRDVPVLQNHGQDYCQVVIDARTTNITYQRR